MHIFDSFLSTDSRNAHVLTTPPPCISSLHLLRPSPHHMHECIRDRSQAVNMNLLSAQELFRVPIGGNFTYPLSYCNSEQTCSGLMAEDWSGMYHTTTIWDVMRSPYGMSCEVKLLSIHNHRIDLRFL